MDQTIIKSVKVNKGGRKGCEIQMLKSRKKGALNIWDKDKKTAFIPVGPSIMSRIHKLAKYGLVFTRHIPVDSIGLIGIDTVLVAADKTEEFIRVNDLVSRSKGIGYVCEDEKGVYSITFELSVSKGKSDTFTTITFGHDDESEFPIIGDIIDIMHETNKLIVDYIDSDDFNLSDNVNEIVDMYNRGELVEKDDAMAEMVMMIEEAGGIVIAPEEIQEKIAAKKKTSDKADDVPQMTYEFGEEDDQPETEVDPFEEEVENALAEEVESDIT